MCGKYSKVVNLFMEHIKEQLTKMGDPFKLVRLFSQRYKSPSIFLGKISINDIKSLLLNS
jgi:hypothetical protein